MCAICGHYGFVRFHSVLNCLCVEENVENGNFFLTKKGKVWYYLIMEYILFRCILHIDKFILLDWRKTHD